jgi:diguanylate cyclase (GGDEF)-like protein
MTTTRRSGAELAMPSEATAMPASDAAAALRQRIRLLEAVIENFPGGLSLYDADLRMVLCNRTQKALLDYPEHLTDALPTMEEMFRFNAERGEYGPGDPEEHVRHKMELVARREAHCYDRTRPNGTIVEVRGMPLEDGGFVTTYLDVTAQRRDQELIAHMARHDPLTNLPNRTLYRDRLEQALAQVRRGSTQLALHFVDLDRFKPVNDQHGHKVGDEVLMIVAERMKKSLRETDTVARLGGDEFVVVQTGIAWARDAEALANRLLGILSQPYPVQGCRIRIGASIGIAMAPLDAFQCEELEQKADAALYRSKHSGRGRFTFHSEGD